MLNNLPFAGDYPILQQFGDSPCAFLRLKCDGAALRGHPGIDFALPAGTPVLAVAAGTVIAAQSDSLHGEGESGEATQTGGFGQYVLLHHHWGQTLYAHLSALHCAPGQTIRAGQTIGLSGNSGLSPQPHLHFGLRILPYSTADGWCGYSDPASYLHRLSHGRGPLIGPHVIGGVHRRLDLLRRWQPRQIVVVDPNPDEMRALRLACPDSYIIGRVFAADHIVNQRILADPLQAAAWAHAQTLARFSPDVDYWQFANEVLQDSAGLPLLARFELERMRLAEQEPAGRRYRCALFGFSVGNPDLPETNRLADWRLLFPALRQAEAQGHIVALHQYGMPDLWGPNRLFDWYIYRLEHQLLRRLPFKRLQFAITEYGIDGLIGGSRPRGWANFTDAAGYVRQLTKSAAYLERYSGRVLGCSVFTLGQFAPWDSYDIEGAVSDELAANANRGPWRDVKTNVTDILPGDLEHATHPGPEALPDCNTGACDLPAPYEFLVERRLDPRFAGYHMQIQRVDQRPDRPQGEVAYVVKDIFMTANGSWEMDGVDEDGNTVPQWARNSYLTREFLEAGADHHLFGAVIGLDGKLSQSARISFWSDGFARLGDPDYDGYVFVPAKPESGWANLPISGGSSFAPDRGESGPWCWAPAGASEVVCGGGLPLNRHISTFVVWQAVLRAELDERLSAAAGDGVYPHALAHPLARRFGQTVAAYNLSVQPLPRGATTSHPVRALVVKDLFTARIDPDCALGAPGSLPSWATEDYRLPPAAARRPGPEACATLYAAVCDDEGRLLPAQEIHFSTDGLSALAASTPTTYNACTDSQTGWAHHVVGPEGAYAPARGQEGDWSWAPRGATEAVCGGGVPMGQQLAIFAVWQAVPPAAKAG